MEARGESDIKVKMIQVLNNLKTEETSFFVKLN